MSGANIVYDASSDTWYATLSDAISDSAAKDLLLISGTFVENFPNITHDLTIEAIGPNLATLRNPQPLPPNNRAIVNVPFDAGVNLTISGLDISGANNDAFPNENGAGILFEIGNGILNVNHCHIHDNEDGVLTGSPDTASPGGTMSVFISDSEIDHNGLAPSEPRYGFDHNIYANALTEFSLTDSYIHDALGGHEIKTAAETSIITGNRIEDGATATTSFSIDLYDGGTDTVTDNLIEKGPASPNDYMVHFGQGGGSYPNSSLLVNNNVFVNERTAGGTAVLNQTQDPISTDPGFNKDFPSTITNNTVYGASLVEDDFGPVSDTIANN
jgi:hypothetical protein